MRDASASLNQANMPALWQKLTSIDERLAWMNKASIDLQLVSPLPSPHECADEHLATAIVRTTNAAVAEHCQQAPD